MGTRAVARFLKALAAIRTSGIRANAGEGNAKEEQPAANAVEFIPWLWQRYANGRSGRCRILAVSAAGANIHVRWGFLSAILAE
jgi:hypothetical protein